MLLFIPLYLAPHNNRRGFTIERQKTYQQHPIGRMQSEGTQQGGAPDLDADARPE